MPTTRERRVAILGGTFDPVHNAHLAMLIAARDQLDAIEGWMVPARRSNLRDEPMASPADRHAMLAAAAAEHAGIRVIDIELHRDGYSYTIDTIDELTSRFRTLECWWIVGADAARNLPQWHRSEELLARGHFAVVQRHGTAPVEDAELRSLGMDPERTRVLSMMPPPIRATDVRARVAAGRAIDHLVPAAVASVIAARGLYRGAVSVHNPRG